MRPPRPACSVTRQSTPVPTPTCDPRSKLCARCSRPRCRLLGRHLGENRNVAFCQSEIEFRKSISLRDKWRSIKRHICWNPLRGCGRVATDRIAWGCHRQHESCLRAATHRYERLLLHLRHRGAAAHTKDAVGAEEDQDCREIGEETTGSQDAHQCTRGERTGNGANEACANSEEVPRNPLPTSRMPMPTSGRDRDHRGGLPGVQAGCQRLGAEKFAAPPTAVVESSMAIQRNRFRSGPGAAATRDGIGRRCPNARLKISMNLTPFDTARSGARAAA